MEDWRKLGWERDSKRLNFLGKGWRALEGGYFSRISIDGKSWLNASLFSVRLLKERDPKFEVSSAGKRRPMTLFQSFGGCM